MFLYVFIICQTISVVLTGRMMQQQCSSNEGIVAILHNCAAPGWTAEVSVWHASSILTAFDSTAVETCRKMQRHYKEIQRVESVESMFNHFKSCWINLNHSKKSILMAEALRGDAAPGDSSVGSNDIGSGESSTASPGRFGTFRSIDLWGLRRSKSKSSKIQKSKKKWK